MEVNSGSLYLNLFVLISEWLRKSQLLRKHMDVNNIFCFAEIF